MEAGGSGLAQQTRIALITGAGTGIGRAAVLALLGAGWSAVLAGRRKELLDAVAEEGDPSGERTLCVATDIGDPAAVKALFAAAKERFGRLDLLFNNAGMGTPPMPLEDLTYEQWSAVVAVNLTGMFLCTQEAFRIMKDQEPRGGRIINNGSISAHTPRPFSAPYTATKHGVTGLTKSAALDGRAYDIACGQIDIGNADTALAAKMKEGVPQADGRIAPEPVMDVDHVGQAIVHMAELPLDTNILFMNIKASKMPFEGRG